LKVTTAISDPNGSAHCMAELAWFWTMNIPQDAGESDWMSECKSYICSSLPRKLVVCKAAKDQWIEEVELITLEIQWTINF
ncbi:hypothetical protein BS17DRAFT_707447, partial [Gyrodon lividus]